VGLRRPDAASAQADAGHEGASGGRSQSAMEAARFRPPANGRPALTRSRIRIGRLSRRRKSTYADRMRRPRRQTPGAKAPREADLNRRWKPPALGLRPTVGPRRPFQERPLGLPPTWVPQIA
ncbi:MAG: hypothetical protein ACK4OK_09905, partial [Thermoflexus sp.]